MHFTTASLQDSKIRIWKAPAVGAVFVQLYLIMLPLGARSAGPASLSESYSLVTPRWAPWPGVSIWLNWILRMTFGCCPRGRYAGKIHIENKCSWSVLVRAIISGEVEMAGRRRSPDRKQRQQASSALTGPLPVQQESISVGLTLADVEAVRGGVFDSVSQGTKGVYEKHLGYFVAWCDDRGNPIPWDQVVTEHVQVYLREKRKNCMLSLSWLGCASGAIKKALQWEGRAGAVDWGQVSRQLTAYRKQDRLQPASVEGLTSGVFRAGRGSGLDSLQGRVAEEDRQAGHLRYRPHLRHARFSPAPF